MASATVEKLILLVDDERTHRDLGRTFLELNGVAAPSQIKEATSVANAENILDEAASEAPDGGLDVLVISDIEFPFGRARRDTDPDGPAAAALAVLLAVQARAKLRLSATNVVATSKRGDLESLGFTSATMSGLGAVMLAEKPYDEDIYTETARTAIEAPALSL